MKRSTIIFSLIGLVFTFVVTAAAQGTPGKMTGRTSRSSLVENQNLGGSIKARRNSTFNQSETLSSNMQISGTRGRSITDGTSNTIMLAGNPRPRHNGITGGDFNSDSSDTVGRSSRRTSSGGDSLTAGTYGRGRQNGLMALLIP